MGSGDCYTKWNAVGGVCAICHSNFKRQLGRPLVSQARLGPLAIIDTLYVAHPLTCDYIFVVLEYGKPSTIFLITVLSVTWATQS